MTRIFLALALILAALCNPTIGPTSAATVAPTSPNASKEFLVAIPYPSFNPFGAYRIWAATRQDIPPGLENFGSFEVWLVSKRKRAGKYRVLTQAVAEQSALDFATFKMSSTALSFTTNAMDDGISYGFDGRFTRGGDFRRLEPGPVLEGNMIKFVKGQKVAEGKVKLDHYIPD